MTDEQLKHIFSYHPPTPEQQKKYESVNEVFLRASIQLDVLMPEGPGKTTAIRKLADARMAVNAAIALEGRF